ncbi:MAG TPA: hypothetical protein VK934_00895 [Fimbriimonas sp.]|nr:hypothetical protein [Fimbriimonas sp.]
MVASETKTLIRGASFLAATACLQLVWVLLGSPPYAFFGFMKAFLALTSIALCYSLLRFARLGMAPSIVLASLAFVHVTGKMERTAWVPWNLAMLATLAICALLLNLGARKESLEHDIRK